ncbi:response regulator [Egbenema bharatensis]|uniref:response regulator n=1 Tax=Egbenema bharatensis TaxID=3463334 RepID=UPI003A891CB1
MKRVLVVDDEERIQEVVQACLEILYGWQVYTASSGTEALEQAKAHQPDAILLDVSMPEMDGITLLQQLRSNPATAKIPVILLTAKSHSLNQLEASDKISGKVSGLITKPFEPLKLAEQIMAILE